MTDGRGLVDADVAVGDADGIALSLLMSMCALRQMVFRSVLQKF